MDILGFDKLLYHHERIRKIGRGERAFPVHATVSLGNYCNHACLWCSVFEQQQKLATAMDADKLLDFLSRASAHGLKAVGYVGNGEPTAHPEFARIVEETARLGLEQGMFTNGALLHRYEDAVRAHFTYLRISLDAGSRAMHDRMHAVQGHFERVIENVAGLIARREGGRPTVGIHYATHHENIGDLFESARLARDIGADYFSVKPVFNRGSVGERIEKNRLTFEDLAPVVAEARGAFESRDFRFYFRPFQIISEEADRNVLTYDRCVAGYFNVNVYEDESVVFCGPHHVPVGRMDDDLSDIESRIAELSPQLDLSRCPAGCRYHALNHLVDTVLQPARATEFHVNFL